MITDAIDLHAVVFVNSPDVASWPATVAITRIDMHPVGGLSLMFDRPLPDAWKAFTNGPHVTDNIQFTVWAVLRQSYAAGFIQMWQGRTMGDRSLPPILTGSADWWNDPRGLWPGLAGYVPAAGDWMAFFVTAGNARLESGVTSVAERSNVVMLRLPAGDAGSFSFPALPPSVPDEPPAPLPPNFGDLIDAITTLDRDANALTTAIRALEARISNLQAGGLKLRW